MSTKLAKRDALICAHLDLPRAIAQQIRRSLPSSFELEDLIQTGTLGLIRAARDYRPAAHGGTPFSAWARHKIRGAILDSVRGRNYTHATRTVQFETDDRRLDVEDRARRHARKSVQTGVVRQEHAPAGGGGHQVSPEAQLDAQRERVALQRAIHALPGRQKDVVALFVSPEEPRDRAIAAKLKLSTCYVSKLRVRGVRALVEAA